MMKDTIIQAWKDPEFRASLSAEERAMLPESPVGRSLTELEPEELASAVGGRPLLDTINLDIHTRHHLICDGLRLAWRPEIPPGDPLPVLKPIEIKTIAGL
jgi:mersacidin/lichenicidin family type 2 lantibiotic